MGGALRSRFVRSSFHGDARHSLKSSLPAVCRCCCDHIHSATFKYCIYFTLTSSPSFDACMLARYLRLWDEDAWADPLGQKEKKRKKKTQKKTLQAAEEATRRSAWRSCDISGESPIGQESPAAISKPQLPPSLLPRFLPVDAPTKPPQPCENEK